VLSCGVGNDDLSYPHRATNGSISLPSAVQVRATVAEVQRDANFSPAS
jgi:hypothetical protein